VAAYFSPTKSMIGLYGKVKFSVGDRGQFHQHTGARYKCAGAQSRVQKMLFYLINTNVSKGRIFSHAGNELGASLFLVGNKFLNDFPLHLMPSGERAHFQTDKKYGLKSTNEKN
jgi:hypothetical protein